MDRDLEIQKIAKRIQKDIDKLKKLNCFIDHSGHRISVFDDNIKPKKGLLGAGDDYSNAEVFYFK
jgi:hypothetical protein